MEGRRKGGSEEEGRGPDKRSWEKVSKKRRRREEKKGGRVKDRAPNMVPVTTAMQQYLAERDGRSFSWLVRRAACTQRSTLNAETVARSSDIMEFPDTALKVATLAPFCPPCPLPFPILLPPLHPSPLTRSNHTGPSFLPSSLPHSFPAYLPLPHSTSHPPSLSIRLRAVSAIQ